MAAFKGLICASSILVCDGTVTPRPHPSGKLVVLSPELSYPRLLPHCTYGQTETHGAAHMPAWWAWTTEKPRWANVVTCLGLGSGWSGLSLVPWTDLLCCVKLPRFSLLEHLGVSVGRWSSPVCAGVTPTHGDRRPSQRRGS